MRKIIPRKSNGRSPKTPWRNGPLLLQREFSPARGGGSEGVGRPERQLHKQPYTVMETEILAEIRKVRDEHAKECGYDVHRAFEQMRAESEQLKAEGWRVIDRSAGE